MLLAVDVGNTNVTLALFDGERLAADWRVTSRREWTADEVAVELRQLFSLQGLELGVVTGVVISSVVPTINPALVEASRRYLKCEPVMVGPGVKTGVRIRYDNPKDVGADRIANALAAYSKYGGPVIVIDFGTAVTYDAINADGDYLGGAIAPGVEISLDALVSQTAMLRRAAPGLETARLTDPGQIEQPALVRRAPGQDAPEQVASIAIEVPVDASVAAVRELVRIAMENVALKQQMTQLEAEAHRRHRQFRELNRSGMALSAGKDIDRLQSFILTTMRQLTHADGASVWLNMEVGGIHKLFLASGQT